MLVSVDHVLMRWIKDFQPIEMFCFANINPLVGKFSCTFFAPSVDILTSFGFSVGNFKFIFKSKSFKVPFLFSQEVNQMVHVIDFLYVRLSFWKSKLPQYWTFHFLSFPLFIIIITNQTSLGTYSYRLGTYLVGNLTILFLNFGSHD